MDLAGNNEITLEEMLDARERRVFLQNSLIQTYNKPIISFTLNIPGPVKVFDKIPETFEEGVRKIRQALCDSAITVYHESEVREKTGYEAFFSADASPLVLKRLMSELEDGTSVGRLYDIDIIRQDGCKVSREETAGRAEPASSADAQHMNAAGAAATAWKNWSCILKNFWGIPVKFRIMTG